MEVEAKVIDTDITQLSKADEWLAQANEKAELLAEQYRPHEITSERDYKDSKKARSDARKDIAALEAERKSMTTAIEKAVRDFKDGAKLALQPLSDIDSGYATEIHAYEERWKAERTIELAQEYSDLAPALTELVPFDLVLQRYGSERGKVWTNRSTNVVAAKEMLADAVYDIHENEKAIDSLVPDEDKTEAKALFFQTLNLNAALAEARRLKEQRDRVRQLEAERLAWEMQQAAQEPQPMVEPDPQPQVDTAFAPQDVPRAWVVNVPSATRAQMQQLAQALTSLGLQGTIKAL